MTDIDRVQTLPELLAWRATRSPQGEAYREYEAGSRQWRSLCWRDVQTLVGQWQAALASSGVGRGARVAILLPNGLQAMSIDQATLAQGAVPVPLHAIDNPGSIAYILSDCEASLLLVSQAEQWQKIRAVGTPLPALRTVVVAGAARGELPGTADAEDVRLIGLSDWLGAAQADVALAPPPGPEDLAAIVYTSGTTGKPKGVMLTHRNVISNVQAVLARIQPLESDVFLSFLPLSHTFERTAGYYLPIAAGSCVAYARSVAQLGEDLQTVRPTVLISVPRIYERVHAKLLETLSATPWKLQLLEAAQATGWRRFRAAQGLSIPAADEGAATGLWRLLPWPLLRALVARPLLARFGGRVRVAVSGGAPLSPAIARCFLGLGLPLLQGYGMTETSPVLAVNLLDDNDPATVGRALPGVETRIGENRELQVRAPSVMKGYWKRADDTARILDAQGWLATGDQAEIVDGRIRILGRIKEIIVTSTGEKVPPGDLELAITADPLFEQAFVVGEQRPFIACVAVLQREEWQRLADDLGVDAQNEASLADARVIKAALTRIEQATASFARYAVPRALCLTLTPWTIENGFMTPTLKLKRNNLMAHFNADIEALYQKPGR
ncbi:MAG: AMP-binding protein [Hylemonella sp.]|uniref:AMP-dependent synthetase/ligase n=1 Tax=Hylemonella sp. TaxID=2066020 RepID=UPI0022BD690B|nr:AMP-binding protein [Hylemonella sp.]MCZ8251430.1 AMP-binding protein [Hylemonella sp.]